MHRVAVSLLSVLAFILPGQGALFADSIPVRFPEGSVHGYLALRSLDGKLLASGDLFQTVHGSRLTAHLRFRFKDGSVDDDTAVFTQRGHFHLLSDHHIQKGPSFPHPVELLIKAETGEVTVRYQDKDQEKVETEHMDLPSDLANGFLLDALKNISPAAGETRVSFVVATPKPRLLRFSIKPEGPDTFHSAGLPNRATRFNIHVEIGGITGVLAELLGKQPPDAHVWIGTGQVPAFIRSEQPLFLGGPLQRIELVGPVWHDSSAPLAK